MCRCLDCRWIKKESLTCAAPGYRSRPQLTPKRVWRTRTCRYFSPKLYCIAGKSFLDWMGENLPEAGFEDWSAPCRLYLEIKLCERGFKVSKKLIQQGISSNPEWNIHPQDYRLFIDNRYICWVDVRYAEEMKDGCYFLDEKKSRDFLFISEESSLPTYLVVYSGEDFKRFWWTKLEKGSDCSRLSCEPDISFRDEIAGLIGENNCNRIFLPSVEKTINGCHHL